MLKSIQLVRFKKFKDTKLILEPFTILTGGNNAGKTTVLQAVYLALHSLNEGHLLSVDRRTLQSKVSGTGCYLFDLPFVSREDLSSLFYNRISRGGSTYDENSGAMVELTDERGNDLKLHIRELFKNVNVKLITPEEELRAPSIQKKEPLYLQGNQNVKLLEERLFPAAMVARITEGDAASAVRNMILDLRRQSPKKYRYFEQILEIEFDIRICEMQFDESNERYLVSEYEEKSQGMSGVPLEFGSCGSGVLNVIQLLAAILRYCPEKSEVVLLDRPDAGLDGVLALKFVNALRDVQKKLGIQILLTSDSETVLRAADSKEILPVLADARINRTLCCEESDWKAMKEPGHTSEAACGAAAEPEHTSEFACGAAAELENTSEAVYAAEPEHTSESVFEGMNKPENASKPVCDDFHAGQKLLDCLDGYELMQVKCSGVLGLCDLGRRKIAQLRRIGEKSHAEAFCGSMAVPIAELSWKEMQHADALRSDGEETLARVLGRKVRVVLISEEIVPAINQVTAQTGVDVELPEVLEQLFLMLKPEKQCDSEKDEFVQIESEPLKKEQYEQLSFPLE